MNIKTKSVKHIAGFILLIAMTILTTTANSETLNLSTRGFVTPDKPLHGGLVGSGGDTIIVRATTTTVGLPDNIALPDPKITIYKIKSNGVPPEIVGSNDNWMDGDFASDIEALGLSPTTPLESALSYIVPNGYELHTFVVESNNSSSGEVLIEIFKVNDASPIELGDDPQIVEAAKDLANRGFAASYLDVFVVHVGDANWDDNTLGCDNGPVSTYNGFQRGFVISLYPGAGRNQFTYHTSVDPDQNIHITLCEHDS